MKKERDTDREIYRQKKGGKEIRKRERKEVRNEKKYYSFF